MNVFLKWWEINKPHGSFIHIDNVKIITECAWFRLNIDEHFDKKDSEDSFLIRVELIEGPLNACFIDDVVLKGNKKELYEKLKDIDFVKSLGIDESFYFEKFSLVPEDEVDFPDYTF